MPVNDPIGDLLTRMRNAQHARHVECRAPWSIIKEQLCRVLKDEGYLLSVDTDGEMPTKEIVVGFNENKPVLRLKRVSTPGGRKYVGKANVRPVLHGASTAILTTSQGILTHREAKKRGIGGEVLCTVAFSSPTL